MLARHIEKLRFNSSYRPIAQEHPLGCAVACVASRCGIPYERARALFSSPEGAGTRGYDCAEVVEALARAGLRYRFEPFDPAAHAGALATEGTLVFVEPGAAYPAGHYLVRGPRGWMNSWLNYPRMVPVDAGFQRELPGRPAFVFVPDGPG